MPEGGTRSETLRAGKPFAIGGATLLPIERVVIRVNRGHGRVWFAAIKEPYALALRDAGGVRAVDVDANAVPLEHLRKKVPGFEAVLATM